MKMQINSNAIFWITLILLGTLVIVSLRYLQRRNYLIRKNEVPLKRKPSEFLFIMGLMISSVLDPSSKARIEQADRLRNKKVEPGKENA